jgi:hypothetical protein
MMREGGRERERQVGRKGGRQGGSKTGREAVREIDRQGMINICDFPIKGIFLKGNILTKI